MGPEELAIIMSPQFINATFRAGEDWYHSMVARNQEARRRNDFENANAELVRVNHLVISRSQEQNLRWKRYAETLDQRLEVLVRQVNARGEFGERVAGELDVASRNLAAKTTLCSQKDATIAQERQKVAALQAENEKLRAALSAAESDRQRLHEDNAAFLSAADHFEQKCKDLESDLERSQHALQEEEAQNLRLSQDFQNAHLVNEALLSASLSALPLMEQTRGLWAAQDKPSMMDAPLASHCRTDGQPLTVREYLWFATLMREMTAHNVPDHLVSTYCPVAQRGDFLTCPVAIQEKRPD